MRLISAVDSQWGIGKDGGLLFRIPEDMRFFKRSTTGGTILMGGATLRSLPGGRPLAGRKNIVLTRQAPEGLPEGVVACSSLDAVFRALEGDAPDRTWVIGGAGAYGLFAPFCDKAFITKVGVTVPDADRFMVNLDTLGSWRLQDESEPHESGGLRFRFCTYVNDEPVPYPLTAGQVAR